VSRVVIALGLWGLLDLAAGSLTAWLIEQYPAPAASGGLGWILAIVLGLFAVAFVLVLSRVAGQRVAQLISVVLLSVYSFQAVAALAWRLGATVAHGGDLLGFTRYAGGAVALAAALAVLGLVPGFGDRGEAG
jgi:hypothetical protein